MRRSALRSLLLSPTTATVLGGGRPRGCGSSSPVAPSGWRLVQTPVIPSSSASRQTYRCYATIEEPLEVEILEAAETTKDTASTTEQEDSPFDDLVATHITKLDSFATSRVAMCLKRVNGAAAGAVKYQLSKEPKKDAATGKTIHRAEAKFLVNGKPHKATGYSIGDPKEAELACATHIERLLDNFGIVMFQLSRKQGAHVEAAKADGRFAPMPNAKPRAVGEMTKVPPIKYRPSQGVKKKSAATASGNVVMKKKPDQPRTAQDLLRDFRTAGVQAKRDLVIKGLASKEGEGQGGPDSTTEIVLDAEGQLVKGGDEWGPNRHFTCKIFPRKGAIPPHLKGRDETEGGEFCLVEPFNGVVDRAENKGYFHHTPLTLLSPALFCNECLPRAEAWWVHAKLPKTFATSLSISAQKVRAFGSELYEGKMELPFAKGTFVRAKASSRELVIKLAAMHFELLCDSLGVPLFQSNETQKQHADDVKCVGRWAIDHVPDSTGEAGGGASALATIDGKEGKARRSVPKGLKEWVGIESPKQREFAMKSRVAPLTPDEDLVSYNRSIINTISLHCSDRAPPDAHKSIEQDGIKLGTPQEIIRQFLVGLGEEKESFYFCNESTAHTFRASLALPLPLTTYGVRGGYAVGGTIQDAKNYCASHAIDVLCSVGVAVFSDAEKQAAFVKYRKERELFSGEEAVCHPRALSPPGLRIITHKKNTTPQPPSRDWDYAYSSPFGEWTRADEVFFGSNWGFLERLTQTCYLDFFGEPLYNEHGAIRFHHMAPSSVRLEGKNYVHSESNVCWLRRPFLPAGQTKHEEAPIAMGRCAFRATAEKMCCLHFLAVCLRLSALHKKFSDNEFVDEETLPQWFGRGDNLKDNSKKMAAVFEPFFKSSLLAKTLVDPDQHEQEMRDARHIDGAALFHSVGFTTPHLWDSVMKKQNLMLEKRQRYQSEQQGH